MNIRVLKFAPLALLAFTSLGMAQDSDKKMKDEKMKDEKMHDTKMHDKMGKSMSMTGCLTKGEMENHYSFFDKKTGKKMTVTGSPDLEKHSANHTVMLTGSRSAKVFNVTALEHVAPTCEAKK